MYLDLSKVTKTVPGKLDAEVLALSGVVTFERKECKRPRRTLDCSLKISSYEQRFPQVGPTKQVANSIDDLLWEAVDGDVYLSVKEVDRNSGPRAVVSP